MMWVLRIVTIGVVFGLVGCGSVDSSEAQRSIGVFREYYRTSNWDAAYGLASKEMKRRNSPKAFENFMIQAKSKYGEHISSMKTRDSARFQGSGAQRLIRFESTFERGRAVETFVFVAEEGRCVLSQYDLSRAPK